MSRPPMRDIQHIFESLRKGLVPERGIESFAEGIEKQRGEIHRQLDLAMNGEGTIKFLRGDYGCGKTFNARLAILDAQNRGFATSFVVVSDNDLRFYRFEEVYRKVLTELGTSSCPRGALGDILDRWIAKIEDALISAGADEDADDFDDQVRKRLDEELISMTGGRAPQDFIRVIQTIFDLKQQGDMAEAGALISWLCGSANVAASAKKAAGIKGDIQSSDALDYLRGVLEIVKAAGYQGLLIVIDEAETIMRMRSDSRGKSLNGIRQIADKAGDYPGLLWIFTGTPNFFDDARRGVASLPPLHDRIQFQKMGKFVNRKQPQLELVPFDAERLRKVALKLRELYPASDPGRTERLVHDEFIDNLVAQATEGFKGDVGVVPRVFLRNFVTVLDNVEDYDDFVPDQVYEFAVPDELNPAEQQAISGEHEVTFDDDGGLVAVADVW